MVSIAKKTFAWEFYQCEDDYECKDRVMKEYVNKLFFQELNNEKTKNFQNGLGCVTVHEHAIVALPLDSRGSGSKARVKTY